MLLDEKYNNVFDEIHSNWISYLLTSVKTYEWPYDSVA